MQRPPRSGQRRFRPFNIGWRALGLTRCPKRGTSLRLRSLRTVPRSLFRADRQHRRVLGFMHTHYKGYSYVVNFFFFHSFLCLPRVVFESTSGSAPNFSNLTDDRDALVPISLRNCIGVFPNTTLAFRRPNPARTLSELACNSLVCVKHTSPVRQGHIMDKK